MSRGKDNADQGERSYKKAKTFATRAQQGRKTMLPTMKDLVIKSTQLLADACYVNGDIDEASSLQSWIRNQDARNSITSDPESNSPNSDMADVLHWCKSQVFDVDSPTFPFETPNSAGKTPLHIAVSEEDLDIISQIVNCTRKLEVCNADS